MLGIILNYTAFIAEATKPTGRSTGLGLATIYGIVKDAAGDVQLDSEPGIGATVRV